MVSPMDHMRMPSAHCMVDNDPRVVETREDDCFDDTRPTHAAPTVHKGAYLVNRPATVTSNDDTENDDLSSSCGNSSCENDANAEEDGFEAAT